MRKTLPLNTPRRARGPDGALVRDRAPLQRYRKNPGELGRAVLLKNVRDAALTELALLLTEALVLTEALLQSRAVVLRRSDG